MEGEAVTPTSYFTYLDIYYALVMLYGKEHILRHDGTGTSYIPLGDYCIYLEQNIVHLAVLCRQIWTVCILQEAA